MHEEATKSIESWFCDGLQVTQCHTVTKKDVPVPYFMPLLAVTAMYGQWDLGID